MAAQKKLEAQTVSGIFRDCLFTNSASVAEYLPAHGITMNVGFDPAKIAKHSDEIGALLDELPLQFHAASGGGWSFLQACDDKHGCQWTGMHSVIEELFLLGMAAGRVKCLLPRDMWSALPGGVPYYVVTADPFDVQPEQKSA